MRKLNFNFLSLFFIFVLTFSLVRAEVFVGGDNSFNVDVSSQEAVVFNDDISAQFKFEVTNLEDFTQEIDILLPEVSGWDILVDFSSFELDFKESREVIIYMYANSNFEYDEEVVSNDVIRIGKRDDYRGFFEFPVEVKGVGSPVFMKFDVEIVSRSDLPLRFVPKFSSNKVSPISPLSYSIEGVNLVGNRDAKIMVNLGDVYYERFDVIFEENQAYKVFVNEIGSDVLPGTYQGEVRVRVEDEQGSAQEWFASQEIEVLTYKNIDVEESFSRSFLKDVAKMKLTNLGNVDDVYVLEIDNNWFESLFFGVESEFESLDYEEVDGIIRAEILVGSGEVKNIEYYYNFIPIYVILFVGVIVGTYIYQRKASNPLAVETKIYEVKKVSHEGIKSMKFRIGFENIKSEEISHLRMIFRMPSYLSVKEDSFLLAPPKNVLRGQSQYKLVWDFSRFEKNDSRILGFTLMNSKGILGDVRLPDLEFEVKIDGKVKRYKIPVPIVRG